MKDNGTVAVRVALFHTHRHAHTLSCHLSAPFFVQYISSWRGKALLTRQASAFSCSVALAVRERDFFTSAHDRLKCFNFPLAWRKWLHKTFGVHRVSERRYTEPELVLHTLGWTLKESSEWDSSGRHLQGCCSAHMWHALFAAPYIHRTLANC